MAPPTFEDPAAATIVSQIEAATALPALRSATQHIDAMVLRLHAQATPVERIAHQVGRLNGRIFARLWSLLAPPELVSNSCLLVMGSEGRGEQILKTDQDNALLLRDGFECPGLEAIAQDFNAALTALGYPSCPGDIMLTNPRWRQPLAAFRETLRGWLYGIETGDAAGDGPMHLAIFFDAAVVAGDAALLDEARAYLDSIFSHHDAFLARFAAAADQFHEPRGWFTWLLSRRDEQALDLKKLGTFPIVHGVRALSLQYGVREPGTAARLQRLAAVGRLSAPMAADLTHALHVLMQLRLTHQLHQRSRGELPDNELRPSALDPLEREPLRDALSVVKSFRQFLRHHYRLDAF